MLVQPVEDLAEHGLWPRRKMPALEHRVTLLEAWASEHLEEWDLRRFVRQIEVVASVDHQDWLGHSRYWR